MKRALAYIGVILLIILAIGIYGSFKASKAKLPAFVPTQTACTMEAKLCPDGSSVGRSGPECRFAACPTKGPTTNPGNSGNQPHEQESTIAMINQRIFLGGIHITPIEILEDSRCPTDVECIWAGTIRVRVKLESDKVVSQTSEFSLSNTVVYANKRITLVRVNPYPSTTSKYSPSAYQFEFSVK